MTMIERVARAMCRRHQVDGFGIEIIVDKHIAAYVDAAVEHDWPRWTRDARAAIEAMREPTNEMLDAAARGCAARPAVDNETDTTFIWQTMIDAALKITP